MKRIFSFICVCLMAGASLAAKSYSVKSPDGRLELSLNVEKTSEWTLKIDGAVVSEGNRLAMELCTADKKGAKTQVLGDNLKVQKIIRSSKNETVCTPLYRQKSVQDHYNSLIIKAKGGYSIEMRAYNEGVAYRFVTNMKDSLLIKNEIVEFHTGGKMDAVIPYKYDVRADIYECSFENQYDYIAAGSGKYRTDRFAFLPMYVDTKGAGKLLLMESDVLDYPGMFVSAADDNWTAVFPPIPTKFHYSKRWNEIREEYSDVIARTTGTRSFPWRVIGYAQEDTGLPTNNLSWLLATPSQIEDLSWITPGLSTWDWWNGIKLLGVDFKAGVNTETYKYHTDFAAKFGLKYVLVDEGWYQAPNIFEPIPEMDIQELCDYAAAKGVKVILWSTGGLVDMAGIEKVCEKYAALGVAGFKLDFFDGQDQLTIKQVEKISKICADYKLVLDLHGIYKPAGFNRTWPNVLNFEGVYGAENLSRKDLNLPLYNVTVPYIRMASGPMDYTPGVMRNGAKEERVRVARGGYSQGTRAHQIAQYIVFDQPYGMLCDSPSYYEREPETTHYIASIPTVFDQSFIQSGKVGESIVSVREKDGKWYVGGLTNWDSREVSVDFSFLPEGKWTASIYQDGVNADRFGQDYRMSKKEVDNSSSLTIRMAQGGGFAIILEK